MSFNCVICKKVFANKANLDRHKKSINCAQTVGLNPTVVNAEVEAVLVKLCNHIREQVFKLEKTNDYSDKEDFMDNICEATANYFEEYFQTKNIVQNQNHKIKQMEERNNNIIENGVKMYVDTKNKIKELEKELDKEDKRTRVMKYINENKSRVEKLEFKQFSSNTLEKYLGWSENFDDIEKILTDSYRLTYENIDKLINYDNWKNFYDWLLMEYQNYQQYAMIKFILYYLKFKFQEHMDLSFDNEIGDKTYELKEQIHQLKYENDVLETNYFILTNKENNGIHLSEFTDLELQEKNKAEAARNKRVLEQKRKMAEAGPVQPIDSDSE